MSTKVHRWDGTSNLRLHSLIGDECSAYLDKFVAARVLKKCSKKG